VSESKKTEAKHNPLHDAFGIVLVGLGALLGISAVLFLNGPAPTNPSTFTVVMSGLIRCIGPAAILWICAGFLFVGGRLFVFGSERGTLRDPIGFVATALGLSILMGAFRPDSIALGGYWGQWIGGSMSKLVGHPVAGVILGLCALLIPAWVIWLRVAPPALIGKANALVGEDPVSETGSEEDARRSARAATAARQAAEDPSGVTTAEADALLPDDAEREEILAALRSVNRSSASTVNHAPSPYPADVRRDGGIPAGARPIETANEPRRSAPIAEAPRGSATPAAVQPVSPAGGGGEGGPGTLRSWSPSKPVSAPLGADADLAGAKDARGAGAAARAASAPELKSAPAASPAKPVAETPKPAAPQSGGILPLARALPIPIPSSAGPVGAPTWESEEAADELDEPELDEAPEAPEASEPLVVDAYGTPLELVAALRGESIAAENSKMPIAEVEVELDEDEDEDKLDQDPEPEGVEPWAADVQIDLDEDDDIHVDEEADLDAAVELDEEDAELDLEPQAAEEDAPISALAVEPSPPADNAEPAEREREVVLQPVQNGLFDSVAPAPAPVNEVAKPAAKSTPKPAPAPVSEPARPAERSAPKPAAKAAPRQRTVVMEPQPAPSESSESAPVGDDLVFRSGLLFLAHKRVAVSMLQREFSLDFKQATAVLDQLQQQGLIGPYLGGQRRDILLTAEEWRARVGAAS